jgi:hypothetical protein
MRLIDADEYEKRIKPYDTENDMDKALYNFAHYHLVTTPTTQPEPCEDFVKVVRCKKCRYVHCDKEFDNYWCNRMSGAFMVEAEGFCKWGR